MLNINTLNHIRNTRREDFKRNRKRRRKRKNGSSLRIESFSTANLTKRQHMLSVLCVVYVCCFVAYEMMMCVYKSHRFDYFHLSHVHTINILLCVVCAMRIPPHLYSQKMLINVVLDFYFFKKNWKWNKAHTIKQCDMVVCMHLL